jgi:hypothetical protein
MNKNRHRVSFIRNEEPMFGLTYITRILKLNYIGLGKKLATLRLKSS